MKYSVAVARHCDTAFSTWKGKCERAETSHLTDEEDKKNSLSKIAALPDPKEEEPEKPHVRSGDEILAELTAEQWEKEHYNVKPKAEAKAESKKADATPRDLIGYPIPAQLMERWNQRQEVQDRITAASRLRCALEEIANKGHHDPLYGLYDWQGMIRTVGHLQFHLGQCKPEIVCYECDGHFEKLKPTKGGSGITLRCHACDDRGFMTQKQWDNYAETKLAVIQEKVKARMAKCKKNGD